MAFTLPRVLGQKTGNWLKAVKDRMVGSRKNRNAVPLSTKSSLKEDPEDRPGEDEDDDDEG